METAIIIPIYNNTQITHQCLISLFKHQKDNPPFTVVAVDDGSDEMTKNCLKSYPIHVLTNEKNQGYLYSTNRGIQYALDTLKADYIVLMNNDVEVHKGWLKNMIKHTNKNDLLGYRGRLYMGKAKHKKACFLEFSCALIKRTVFEKIGLLNPIYQEGYYSDDDFCLQALMQGFKVGQLNSGKPPFAIHHGSATFGKKTQHIYKKLYSIFLKQWEQHQNNPIVATYLKKYTWNPQKKEWGDMKRILKLKEKAEKNQQKS